MPRKRAKSMRAGAARARARRETEQCTLAYQKTTRFCKGAGRTDRKMFYLQRLTAAGLPAALGRIAFETLRIFKASCSRKSRLATHCRSVFKVKKLWKRALGRCRSQLSFFNRNGGYHADFPETGLRRNAPPVTGMHAEKHAFPRRILPQYYPDTSAIL